MRRRLLLIDFERRSLQATRALLEEAGYGVATASTGPEAVAALAEFRPEVVVLEPMIPGQDGFRLCQAIKRGDHGVAPIVVVASRIYRGPRYRSMSREMGADLYVERPQQDELLIPALRRLAPTDSAEAAARAVAAPIPAAVPAVAWALDETQVVPPPESASSSATAARAGAPSDGLAFALASGALSPQPARTALASRPQGAQFSPFADGLSDGEIDDALARALGSDNDIDLGSAIDWLPAPPAPSVGTEDDERALALLDNTLDRSQAAPPETVAPARAELAIDDPEEGDGPSRLGTVPESSATTRTDAELPPDLAVALDRLELVEGTVEDQPAFDEIPGLDDVAAPPEPIVAAVGNEPAAPAIDVDDAAPAAVPPGTARVLESELERAFAGLSFAECESADPTEPPSSPTQQPEESVPANLRGMDIGTAELLSSLEELENSIPEDHGSFGTDSSWNAITGLGDATGDLAREIEVSIPLPPPPPPPELLSFEEIISKAQLAEPEYVSSSVYSAEPSLEVEPLAGPSFGSGPVGPIRVGHLEPTARPTPAREPFRDLSVGSPPNESRVSGWLLSVLAVAVVILGIASGIWFFSSSRSETAAPAPASPARGEKIETPRPDKTVTPEQTPAAKPRTAAGSATRVPDRPAGAPAARHPVAPRPEPERPARSASIPRAEPQPVALRSGAAGPAPAPAASTEMVEPGQLDETVSTLEAPAPVWPSEARAAGLEGEISLSVVIDAEGRVAGVVVDGDPGHGLGEAAKNAVKAWRFTPPRREGKPVSTRAAITLAYP